MALGLVWASICSTFYIYLSMVALFPPKCTSLKGKRLINIILLVTLAYSSAIFEGTDLQKKQVKNMYVGVRNIKKDIEDGVHLVLA
jgi:hypothetical protein